MTDNDSNDLHQDNRRICASILQGWRRDLLRVKGSITDYCLVGENDVQALRWFQSGYCSPAKPFTPVPDGFEIVFGRLVLAAGGMK